MKTALIIGVAVVGVGAVLFMTRKRGQVTVGPVGSIVGPTVPRNDAAGPRLPSLPDLPALALPAVSGAAPNMPRMPDMPSMPGMPAMPSMAGLRQINLPTIGAW